MNKIRNIFLYSGASKEEYREVEPDISNANRKLIVIFSGFATALIAFMLLSSLFVSSASHNRWVYILGFICSLLLFVIATTVAKDRNWATVPLIYIAYSIFYLYGIFIGALSDPTQKTVTFMVILVFMPILFNEPPCRFLTCDIFYIIIFICLCCKNKTGDILSIDIIDACIYGFLGAVSGIVINHIKIKSYILANKLKYASRCDLLTQMNNRNSFETDLKAVEENCKDNLSCLYVDVNGLHELNNTQGHVMGDRMLKFVAEQIKNYLGEEYSYRIGGDEFVTFFVDENSEAVETKIKNMINAIETEGYHVALGLESVDKASLDMNQLIRSTEMKMFQAKQEFYNNTNRDRRKSSRTHDENKILEQ